jgi:SAM-dependent MidA family methyltransferase
MIWELAIFFSSIMSDHPPLKQLIFDRILASPQQRITFAEYMELALCAPQLGYYARSSQRIGSQGDFFTSPHLGRDYGELLAIQVAQMWQLLGQPQSFAVVEMGAGQGLLALDMLRYWQQHRPELLASLDYIIIETATAMLASQQRLLASWPVRWSGWSDLPDEGLIGCVFGNELIDALPVHQVVVQAGALAEVYVGVVEQQLVEQVAALSTPRLAEYFELAQINICEYSDGYRTEVNLAALDLLQTVAQKLQRGYLLLIDYGYSADRYYNPMRAQGTLQCYYQHRHHNNPYLHIGNQDLTAHVDFSSLVRQGEAVGLRHIGSTKQGLFLMALGMSDRLSQVVVNNTDVMATLQQHQALHQLIDPTGLGGFGVLLQGKGLSVEQLVLQGLSVF